MNEPVHIPCPACLSTNRVPAERLGDRPVCGHCKAPLFPDHPVELDERRFGQYLERSQLPVVVDFWATWCGPCRAMAPQFAAAAAANAGRALFAKVDTDAEQGLAARFGIQSIPTLILFQGGRELARHSGALNARQIEAWIGQSAVR